jgi:hypothetical protein
MGKFEDRDFPDAVDSSDVRYMMVEWRIQREDNKCKDCGGNYSLYPNQFEHLPLNTSAGKALADFKKFVKNRRDNVSTDPNASIVRTSLFLLEVTHVADISDDNNVKLQDIIQEVI